MGPSGLNVELRYFGEPGVYSDYLAGNDIPVTRIASSKWRRYFSIQNYLDMFKLFFGFCQALVQVFFYMPDVVFSKGGPGVLPIIFASRFYRIPLVIHESDAVPGLTNSISARKADTVEVAFEEAKPYFNRNQVVNVVGNPVRSSLLISESRATSRASLGMIDELPLILILGGSQGAQQINTFVLEHAHDLLTNFEIVHQVGRDNFIQYQREFEFMSKTLDPRLKERYLAVPFLDDTKMAIALNASDIIVSRSGSAIWEIAAAGKPAILIPLPDSANNHQLENAYAYAKTGAAVVIEEGNLLVNVLIGQVTKMLGSETTYQLMGKAAKNFYRADSADKIASDVIAVSGALKVSY